VAGSPGRLGQGQDGPSWTAAHRAWIAAQQYGEPALAAAIGYYQATLATREAELAAAEAELMPWAGREPLAPAVARLGCYRGIAELGALTLAAEMVDWRRFPAARAFMGWTGLVPAEYSSGERTRRGHITKAEPVRSALTEAAWAYRHAPRSARSCAAARPAPPRTPWPGPGRRSGGCTPGTSTCCTPARPRRRPPSRSPASWPASPGPR
jgi:transposase